MLIADSDTWTLVDANPAAELLTGYLHRELVGMQQSALCPVCPVDDRGWNEDGVNRGTDQDTSFIRRNLQRKDGVHIPIAFSTSSSFESKGHSLVLCVFHVIAELDKQTHRMATLQWALSAYAGAALALRDANSREGLLRAICEAITKESAYVLAFVGAAEDLPGKPVRVVAASGQGKDDLDDLRVSWAEDQKLGNGAVGTAIRTGKFKIIEDTETSAQYQPWRDWAQRNGLRSLISVPLTDAGGWRGALAVYARHPHAFEPVAIEVFEHLAKAVDHGLHALHQKELLDAECLHRSLAQKQLTDALTSMVAALVTAVETRDPYTAGHEARVAEIAYAIGKELGWDKDRLLGLRMAAMVHDIGKISVPTEILSKAGPLDCAEREQMKQHSETGYLILKDIPFTWPIADIMRQHHEKLDGSGYPQGLKADQILPEAKVLAVADIVEAMTSDRPYRKGMDLLLVLEELESQAGTLLDADAVRACLALFRQRNFILPGKKTS